MANYIMLESLNNPQAVAKAFQRALDASLKLKYIKQVIETGREYQGGQDVYADLYESAVGRASVILGDKAHKDKGALFVQIYAPGRYAGITTEELVPEHIVERLTLSLKGTSLRATFNYDQHSKWFQAFLLVPLRTLLDHPKGVVAIR